jgi:predicted phosphohydrolase
MGLLLQKESLSLQWWRTNKLGGAMAIYAISDLHLSLGTDKPMDIFGWGDHASKIKDYWNNKITNEDYILIPGDISWAINLEEASADFDFIDRLPGNKVLSKGNHDYWWCTRRKFEKYCSEKGFDSFKLLHNNTIELENYTVCGTRGWKSLDDDTFSDDDARIYNRELERLRLSLEEGQKTGKEIVLMLHYPPFDSKHRPNKFARIMKKYNVKRCVYGHVHSRYQQSWRNETIDGLQYFLVSSNIIDFNPVRIV